MLEEQKLITCIDKEIKTENPYLKDILNSYKTSEFKNLKELPNIPADEKDFLGIVYQSLLNEGNKNLQGAYYTPQKILNKIFPKNFSGNEKFLDPCCGTGSFLLSIAESITNPENLYGFDIDENACFISKINLILKFKDKIFKPNIFNEDFLLYDKNLPKFDIIATNPPWGALSENSHKQRFSIINSGESFSYFIVKASEHLQETGMMSFVLPESILNVKIHADIREFILNNFHIEEINLFGRAFSGVLTNVVSLKLNKKVSETDTVINAKTQLKINQEVYKSNPHYNFAILDNKDVEILKKIFSTPYATLKDSFWALGIVTGNNAKHISSDPKFGEKIYTGKNIHKGEISNSNQYIKYNRENFQQVAPEEIYRAKEKLVYKFISKTPVFAYDDEQRLFLNSANILIPRLKNYTIKEVLQMLNSELFQYIYQKEFNEIKILKGNLSQLPFPKDKPFNILSSDDVFLLFDKLSKEDISYIKQQL
jgi:predicted RNA methylase